MIYCLLLVHLRRNVKSEAEGIVFIQTIATHRRAMRYYLIGILSVFCFHCGGGAASQGTPKSALQGPQSTALATKKPKNTYIIYIYIYIYKLNPNPFFRVGQPTHLKLIQTPSQHTSRRCHKDLHVILSV